MTHEMEQSRKELAGEYERVQKKAFTNWVNSHLIKAGQKVKDLAEDFRDGTKLILLLELLTNEKLPREKGKMRVHKLQNVQNALDFLQVKKRIKLVNIRNDEIVDGNQKLILGLIWTLILHFQISGAIHDDDLGGSSRPTSPQQISAKAIKDHLLHWAQAATEGYDEVKVTNFSSSWSNGMAFCAILDRHRPDLLDYDDCDPDKPLENLEKAFRVAEEKLDIVRIVDPEDVCVPKPDDKTIMTYMSFLHQAFPDMPPPRKRKGPLSPEEYADLYDRLKSWVDEKTDQVSPDKALPDSTEDLKKELQEVEELKKKLVPSKKKDLDAVSGLHGQLEEQHKKKAANPGVPEGKELPKLQEDWDKMLQDADRRHKDLLDELQRRDGLDAVAAKVLSKCDETSKEAKDLAGEVAELEGKSAGLGSSEMAASAQQLSDKIEKQLSELSQLKPDVDTLKEGKHKDADAIESRVSSEEAELQSLLERIADASRAAGEAEVLTEMEDVLQELEVWLVSSGKFAPNQQIIQQIQDHKNFEEEKLSKAKALFSRISSSTPPPGMEGKVKELEERFKNVVKQTEERLKGLDPVVDRVLEFDTLKNQLEDWCLEQQETIERLPPLEVTDEQLLEQQKECQDLLAAVDTRSDSVQKLEKMASQFFRDTEPVQSKADRYARKIQVSVKRKEEEEDDQQQPSIGEQANMLQSLFEWLKSRITTRTSQISDLMDKLRLFNQHYNNLCKFVAEGNDLLNSEKPVGDTATRIQEQLETCEDFREQISGKQPIVDAMLSVGREVLAEPNTSSSSDDLMKKLTSFIEDWSGLQLGWQNWYDELRAQNEQSQQLSDQLKKFESALQDLEPACSRLFPATVAVKSLDKEMGKLQNKFNMEVTKPFSVHKATYEKLKCETSLLPDPGMADKTFNKFEELAKKVEGLQEELSEVVEGMKGWWGGCEGVGVWMSGAEEGMVSHKPLASSVDIIDKQRAAIKSMEEGMKQHEGDMSTSVKALSDLAEHVQILDPSPIDSYKSTLDRKWKTMANDLDTRSELCRCGKDYLSSYADDVLPFAAWLKGAESRVKEMVSLSRSRDILLLERDEMKTFSEDLKQHGETLTQLEIKGSSFLGSAKTYQGHLQAYLRKVDADLVATPPKCFVDLRTDFTAGEEVKTDNFEGEEYQNGIRVVAGNSANLRRRYDALNAATRQRQQVVKEGVTRRKEFDDCLEAIVGSLADTEERYKSVDTGGDGHPLSVQEKVELIRTLEVECMSLEPKLHELQAKYDLLIDLGQEDGAEDGTGSLWEGEDEPLQEKDSTDQRHSDLLRRLQREKEDLRDELTNAQVFYGALGNFVTWLRTTERKTQRDDPLKLEEEDLEKGLKHLKESSADIEAHRARYEEMCSKCKELLARGVQDGEELQGKLNNVQQRWDAIQVVNEDIKEIEKTLPKLKDFHATYAGLSSDADALLDSIDQYSVSAISTEAVKTRAQEMQNISGDVAKQKSHFDSVVLDSELRATPFDRSQFEKDVASLKEKLKSCDQHLSGKRSELKALEKKLAPMEDLFARFRAWLAKSQMQLASLEPRPSTVEKEERKKTSNMAKDIRDDGDAHRQSLEDLEHSVEEVLALLDDSDQEELKRQLDDLAASFHQHLFGCEAFMVEQWVEDKEAELVAMATSAVQVQPLQEELREAQEFVVEVEAYRPRMTNLSSMAAVADPGEDGGEVQTKSKDLQRRYEDLCKLPTHRQEVLGDFLPVVQQYESSRGAWLDLLCGWEKKANQLSPPMATPSSIMPQLDEMKDMLQDVSDHEPEFTSLKREVGILCKGPAPEAAFWENVTPLRASGCPLGSQQPRPGQADQNAIIEDYEKRLEALKKLMQGRVEELTRQLEKGKEFESKTEELSLWLGECAQKLAGLKIRDPKSSTISCQLLDCQHLAEGVQAKEADKNSLPLLLSELTSGLPSENPDCETLQCTLDSLNTGWANLAQQLAQQQTCLETALGLANVTEGAVEKLVPWVPDTLQHLKSLGPPPAEPELVEQQKMELESLKVKYNSLAPSHASCTEDGQSLMKMCEESKPKTELEVAMADLHSQWEELHELFGDLNEKLSAALAQTQEFQGTAKGLERWMSGMENLLRQQNRIAARSRLVEPQIEAFELIVNDIATYSSTVDQATALGKSLMAESNSEESKKVEDRINALTSQFKQLQDVSQRRMARLKQAVVDSTKFEGQCEKLEEWLKEAESQMKDMPPFSMLSQPLSTQLELVEGFNKDIESHQTDLSATTKAEEDLFATELPSIELCEEHLPALKSSSATRLAADTATTAKDPSVILPDWFDRPGAPDAVETRADLCKRYGQLKAGITWLVQAGTEQVGKVSAYEEAGDKLKRWLAEEKSVLDNLSPLGVSLPEIERQLKEVEELQQKFKGQAPNLEAVDDQGTALMEACQDELSAASGRQSLSDLNESWGDAMSVLAKREEDLKNRLALARSYQTQLNEFEDWLCKPEEELALPLRLEGDPRTLKKQLSEIKNLLSDVEAHQPQLDSLVAAGQALESEAGDSGLSDMEYGSAQDRYDKLKNRINERLSALEATLGQASTFCENLEDLLKQLKKMKAKLKSSEPPHVTPSDVEAQIKDLLTMDKKYCDLEPAMTKCKEEGRNFMSLENGTEVNGVGPSGADIPALLAQLGQSSAEVRGMLDHRRDELASSLETAKKFENDYTDLSAWLREKTEELAGSEMVRGIPEGVQKQLADHKEVQQELSKRQQNIADLSALCQSMTETCSTEDSHKLREKVSTLSASMDGLQRSLLERKRVLTDGLTAATDFASRWSNCMKEIEEKKEKLDGLEAVGADIDTVKTQLEDYKNFEESLTDLKSRITSALGRGKDVRDSCSAQDKPFLKDQMDKLNAAWSQLHSGGLERKHKLEDALLQLGQFHEALGELLMWIASSTARLMEARPAGVDPSAVEAQLQDLESLQSGVSSHSPSVVSLNAAGEKLLASSTAEGSAEVQQDLANLNARWEELKELVDSRSNMLEDAIKKTTDFHNSWKVEVDWLEEAEQKAYGEWKPCGLARTCQADVDAHERFMEDVRSHGPQIEEVKAKGSPLKAQGSPEDKKMVDRWVGDLLKRYDDLNYVMEEKKAQLEDASGRAANFDSLYKDLDEALQKEQVVQASQKPIHSEVEAVKEQMEQHKDHLKALSELEGKLEDLNGWGQLLVKDCVVPDGEVIQERMDSLKLQYDALSSASSERQAALEESLLSLGQFESAYEDLWAWLNKANGHLEDFEPITGDPDAVFAQLAKHKTLQKQIGTYLASKNAVVRAGKQLMKHKSGEDKALLKKKLQNLEKEWEKVCQVSVDRQDKLDEAYMKIGMFRSHVAPLWSWMDKVLPSLDKSEPVHGDVSTVDSLKSAHNSFQKDLESFQATVDAANESGGHLIGEVLDDPSITKEDLDRLNAAWDDLCQQAAEKQGRLDEAHDQADKFEEGYNDLVSWVSAHVAELQNQSNPDEDANALEQQIEENKELVQEVAARQIDYDRINTEGDNIFQLAHPKAVPIMETKLQQLERKWLNLRGKLGARSEALASAQLEQHGLQDMLDSVQAWVSDAEKRMSETEAMPIANDLAAVEEQLAAHEAFQEEMATQQPHMDALNKASRKHKANHTSPDLVKKISSLHKHWQRLWLRSSERHRQLLEARTRLKDIAMARSFNFDNWKKRFVSWVDQQKLRVSDLFRRFDSNHDGMLTREEFMKALKASGLAMNQIELEKIADFFDKDRSGMIDLSDIMSTLKGGTRQTRRRVTQEVVSDAQKIDTEIQVQLSHCTCEKKFQVTRVAEGQYRFGDSQKLRMVRILRSTVMVRVGGGWEPLEEFLKKHDPCRASGRTNAEVRAMLQRGGSKVGMSGFTTKTQSAITTKREQQGVTTNGTHRKPTTTSTREATVQKSSPKHKTVSHRTPPPRSAARSTTPISAKGSASGTTRTRTPVSSSPHHRTAASSRTAVSPDPTAGGAKRTTTPVSGRSSLTASTASSSTTSNSRATGSRIPVPNTSKIPTPSKSRAPTKQT